MSALIQIRGSARVYINSVEVTEHAASPFRQLLVSTRSGGCEGGMQSPASFFHKQLLHSKFDIYKKRQRQTEYFDHILIVSVIDYSGDWAYS